MAGIALCGFYFMLAISTDRPSGQEGRRVHGSWAALLRARFLLLSFSAFLPGGRENGGPRAATVVRSVDAAACGGR
jgi:hypothetical protein